MDSNKAQLQIRGPRLFNNRAVLWINLYGLVLAVPFLGSVAWVSFHPFGPSTFLIPLLVFAALTFCLPIGLGNPYVRRFVQRMKPTQPKADDYIVQLTMRPRLRRGLRELMEDADDVGWLRLGESDLIFEGDSVTFQVRFADIRKVIYRNVGLRGMFLYGARVFVSVRLPGGGEGFEVAERSSTFIPESRRIMSELHQKLADRVGSAKAPESGDVI